MCLLGLLPDPERVLLALEPFNVLVRVERVELLGVRPERVDRITHPAHVRGDAFAGRWRARRALGVERRPRGARPRESVGLQLTLERTRVDKRIFLAAWVSA